MCNNCKCEDKVAQDCCCNATTDCVPGNYSSIHADEFDKIRSQNYKLREALTQNIINELNTIADNSSDGMYLTTCLKNELKATNHDDNSVFSKNCVALMSLIELIDKHIGSNHGVFTTVESIFDNKPISHLKFDDSEFLNFETLSDTSAQNIRNSRVFRDFKTGKISAVGALKCQTVATVDISKHDLVVNQSIFSNNVHYGAYFVYNYDERKWYYCGTTHEVNTMSDFIDESFLIPVIELYDSTDTHNDYYAFIADYDDIPKDFFYYFNFTPIENMCDESKEILEFLEKYHAEDLLEADIEPVDCNLKVEYNDNIIIHYQFPIFLDYLKSALKENRVGFNYAKVSQTFTETDNIIVLKNEPAIKLAISKLIE